MDHFFSAQTVSESFFVSDLLKRRCNFRTIPLTVPASPAISVPYVVVVPRHILPRPPRSKCRVTAMVVVLATALAVATAMAFASPAMPGPSDTAVAEVQPRPLVGS